MTVAVFGDIHGEADQLTKLIGKIRNQFGADVGLYHVGDLIDRGAKSNQVIETCITEHIRGILGNHELWMLNVLAGKDLPNGTLSQIMGGIHTLTSYHVPREYPLVMGKDHAHGIRRNMPQAHKDYIQALPVYRSLQVAGQDYLFVHAGVTTSQLAPVERHVQAKGLVLTDLQKLDVVVNADINQYFWVGAQPNEPQNVAHFNNSVQIFGHRPISAPIDGGHYIALDTGCGTCPPRKLSVVVLKDDGSRTFVHV